MIYLLLKLLLFIACIWGGFWGYDRFVTGKDNKWAETPVILTAVILGIYTFVSFCMSWYAYCH